MFVKSLTALLAISVALVHASEPCLPAPNATQQTQVVIHDENNFCTMLTGFGQYPVAPNEGCGSTYCLGSNVPKTLPYLNENNTPGPVPQFPTGFIVSAHLATVTNATSDYIQITGCMDGSKWGMNPTDEGGQIDSHGWPQNSCQGYKKFVSLLEPATNTYCLRCCNLNVDVDCDTSHSTNGCWNIVKGDYSAPDGNACTPPVGAPNTTVSPTPTLATSSLAPGVTTLSAPAAGTTSGTGSGATTLPTIKGSGAADLLKAGSAIAASLAVAVMAVAF